MQVRIDACDALGLSIFAAAASLCFCRVLKLKFCFAATSHVAWAVRSFSQCGRGREASAGALR